MAERNVILRLESVVSGSVGRAFKTVTTNVDAIQAEFDQAKLAVSETTREMKKLQRAGEDTTDVLSGGWRKPGAQPSAGGRSCRLPGNGLTGWPPPAAGLTASPAPSTGSTSHPASLPPLWGSD